MLPSFFSALFYSSLLSQKGAFPISIKNDLILSYIEALAPGSRVSVRELSETLSVSEGTAYKGIKDAEQLGLVTIRPKAGTIRVDNRPEDFRQGIPALELSRLLGLAAAAGKNLLSREIRRLVVCDGSGNTLKRQLQGQDAGNCLCLCGDRPELQAAVLELGANLLLTGGTKANWTLIHAAEKKDVYILTSPKDSYSLLRRFDAEYAHPHNLSDNDPVGDWMQTPDYLYYNDIVADWQRLYSESNIAKQYPIVDDELEIYGGLDLWTAAAAVPSQRLRSLVGEKIAFPKVSARDDIRETARKFVINGDELAAVMDGKRMVGILTANDLLRYYISSEPGSPKNCVDAFLEWDQTASIPERAVFNIRIPETEISDFQRVEIDLIVSAVGEHLRRQVCKGFRLESGSFYVPETSAPSVGLVLTSQIRRTGCSYAVEAEINDEKTSYARAILIVSGSMSREE